jgi:TRAP-type C4-dicarboxylate transport system, small permease component
LRKICCFLNSLYTYVAVVLLAAIIVASSLQVFTRYAMNASMVGTEEVARFCFIWMSLLGGSVCIAKNAHPAVTVISDLLANIPRRVLNVAIYLLILLSALLFLYYGYKMLQVIGNRYSPTLRVRMDIVFLSLPVGAVGMICNSLLGLCEQFTEGRTQA